MDGHDVTITLNSGSTSELHPYGTAARHRRQVQRLSRLRCAAERQMRRLQWSVYTLRMMVDEGIKMIRESDRDAVHWHAKASGRADTIRRLLATGAAIRDLFDARVLMAMPRDERVQLIEILWPETERSEG